MIERRLEANHLWSNGFLLHFFLVHFIFMYAFHTHFIPEKPGFFLLFFRVHLPVCVDSLGQKDQSRAHDYHQHRWSSCRSCCYFLLEAADWYESEFGMGWQMTTPENGFSIWLVNGFSFAISIIHNTLHHQCHEWSMLIANSLHNIQFFCLNCVGASIWPLPTEEHIPFTRGSFAFICVCETWDDHQWSSLSSNEGSLVAKCDRRAPECGGRMPTPQEDNEGESPSLMIMMMILWW